MSLIGRLIKIFGPKPAPAAPKDLAPAAPAAAPRPYFYSVDKPAAPSAGPRNAVLIVDDDEKMRELLSDFMESLGYKVATASDGWQAVVQAEGMNFRLIISDVQMPGPQGTGLHAYIALRKSAHVRRDMPLIFVTGMQPEKVMPYMPKDPLVRILFKPIDLGLLKKNLHELLPP